MKRTALAAPVASMLLTLTVLGPAQTTAPSFPPLYLMADIRVEVAKVSDYETALKDMIAGAGQHGFPIQFDTYATDDGHYYIIYGVEDHAGVERWKAAWRDLDRKMGPGAFADLGRRMAAAELGRDYRFWYFRTDISYLPQPERLKPEEIAFYAWDYVWLVPGSEAAFEALNKEWIALSRSRGARDPFLTYAGELGSDGPVYCWLEYGKSAADYASAEERFWESLGPDGAALSKRTRAMIRRTESKTGRYRPDLSYAPRK